MLKPVITQHKQLERHYDKAMVELNSFFNKNWVKGTPKLFIVEDRKTIDEIKGKETERWVVGFSWGRYAVFILNPDKFETESSQQYSEEDIYKLIKHELCHCFYTLMTGEQHPWWLGEGLALYAAKQLERYSIPRKFKGFLDGRNVYQEGGHAVRLLVEKYGKERLLEFVKGIEKTKDVDKLFKKIFNISLSYKSFNDLL